MTHSEKIAIIPRLLAVEAKEKKITRRTVMIQMVITIILAIFVYSISSALQLALAVLSGGGISVVNGALLAWRMEAAALNTAQQAHHQLRLMYYYAAERFLVVVVLLCLGMAVLKLSPLAMLGGFIVGQAVILAGRLLLSRFKTEIVTKNV